MEVFLSQVVRVPLRVWLGGRKVGLGGLGVQDQGGRDLSGSGAPKAEFKLRNAYVPCSYIQEAGCQNGRGS